MRTDVLKSLILTATQGTLSLALTGCLSNGLTGVINQPTPQNPTTPPAPAADISFNTANYSISVLKVSATSPLHSATILPTSEQSSGGTVSVENAPAEQNCVVLQDLTDSSRTFIAPIPDHYTPLLVNGQPKFETSKDNSRLFYPFINTSTSNYTLLEISIQSDRSVVLKSVYTTGASVAVYGLRVKDTYLAVRDDGTNIVISSLADSQKTVTFPSQDRVWAWRPAEGQEYLLRAEYVNPSDWNFKVYDSHLNELAALSAPVSITYFTLSADEKNMVTFTQGINSSEHFRLSIVPGTQPSTYLLDFVSTYSQEVGELRGCSWLKPELCMVELISGGQYSYLLINTFTGATVCTVNEGGNQLQAISIYKDHLVTTRNNQPLFTRYAIESCIGQSIDNANDFAQLSDGGYLGVSQDMSDLNFSILDSSFSVTSTYSATPEDFANAGYSTSDIRSVRILQSSDKIAFLRFYLQDFMGGTANVDAIYRLDQQQLLTINSPVWEYNQQF